MAKIYASTSDAISQREIDHAALTRWAATQGMVLLENDGTLPFTDTHKNIALFGTGIRKTEKGGTGSGDVNQRHVVNLEDGFTRAGFTVTSTQWLDDYDDTVAKARAEWTERLKKEAEEKGIPVFFMFFTNPFTQPYGRAINEADVEAANTDTAVYVISRNSGEGADRKDVAGDYEIAPQELADLRFLGTHFEHVVVILNTSGAVDTKFFHEIPGLSSLFLMSLAGTSSGDSLLDVLTGKESPSGKLTMTWAKNYKDYPAASTFSLNDGDVLNENYTEGIYVGYRYFDTFGITPSYPFGFGGSYTTFSIDTESVIADETKVALKVKVTNTGSHSGREVVQVYYSAPDGKLEKPYQELAAFGKTKELAPGESQTLTLTYQTGLMASYDEECAAWILESGVYYIRVGNSSRNTHIVAAVSLDKTAVTEKLSNRFPLSTDLKEISKAGAVSYTYDTEETEKVSAPTLSLSASSIVTKTVSYSGTRTEIPASTRPEKLTIDDVKAGRATLDELIAQLTVEEMATLCVGAQTGMGGAESKSIIGSASAAVPGAAGDSSSILIDDRNIANAILSDGPAGLRLTQHFKATKEGDIIREPGAFLAMSEMENFRTEQEDPEDCVHYYQYCTAIPSGTLLAQSWDYDVLYKMGELVGREMNEFGVTIWLAPALNIMRDPLCGRNFEYYSEDPLVSGLCAAADTDGVQSHPGIGTCIKHFAANNQEEFRYGSSSNVSERTLREIYLRGFEMCVKASQPMSIMSSYNLINDVHTANCYDLLTAVARDEWGFAGVIMTDWGTTGGGMGPEPTDDEDEKEKPSDMPDFPDIMGGARMSVPSLCIYAGNDWIMPGCGADIRNIIASVEADEPTKKAPHPISKADLQDCVRHILNVLIQTSRYEGAKPYSAQFEKNWFMESK